MRSGIGAGAATQPIEAISSRRVDAIDLARGAALAAMIAYHFAWDLSFLGFVETDVARHPVWVTFARAIASSFLFLVGIGLVLAHEGGIRWSAVRRRTSLLVAAALAITIVTYAAFPDSFIFFGILHMIALGSLLALPFLRLPPSLTFAAALIALVLPLYVGSPAFDSRWLAWTGFYETPPPTNDFEPVFPWLAPILLGVAAARAAQDTPLRRRLAAMPLRSVPSRALIAMGRNSLLVYLIHQPILLAVLFPLALLRPEDPARQAAAFVQACEASCVTAGGESARCRASCGCVAQTLAAQGLQSVLSAQVLSADEQTIVDRISRQCFEPRPRELE